MTPPGLFPKKWFCIQGVLSIQQNIWGQVRTVQYICLRKIINTELLTLLLSSVSTANFKDFDGIIMFFNCTESHKYLYFCNVLEMFCHE